MFENQAKVGQDKHAESGLGGMLHQAVDFCKHETNAAWKAASNAGGTVLHDLQIVEHKAADVVVKGAASTFITNEAIAAGTHFREFLKTHPGAKDVLIDVASGIVAGCAVTASAYTGPLAVALGAETGAATYVALHKLMGDKITAGGVLNGMIDGATGGIGGALEKAAATQLAKTSLRTVLEGTLAKAGAEGLEGHISNILIKGAKEGAAELETMIKVGSKTLKVDRVLGAGTDWAREQIYQTAAGRGLSAAAKVLREQQLFKKVDELIKF